MKPVIFVIVALVATFLSLAAGAPACGAGGAPDASKPSMCNCYSGFSPSSKAYADCNVNPLCPPIEKSDDSVGEYGANRPITSFAADRLSIYQSLPIVANRQGATIRLVHPVGIPGVVAGTPGASTCGYPGLLWNKTVNEQSCIDEFRGSIPWNSNGMCGFVLDSTQSTNATVIYRTTMVTQYNETFVGWNSQIQLRVLSKAYSIAVSFVRQLSISNLMVNVSMNAPGLTLDVVGNVMYDSLTGTTELTLRTSAPWPYKIDTTSMAFKTFVSTLATGAPTGITAPIVEDTSASLSCGTTVKSLCYQQWTVTIRLGSSEACNIEGVYTYASNLLCRDGAACGGAPNGSFSLTLLPTDFCFVLRPHCC